VVVEGRVVVVPRVVVVVPPAATNHGCVRGEFRKKSRSIVPTFWTPLAEGCVPSVWKSEHTQTRPSERAVVPSAHRYAAQAIHGATVVKFRSPATGSGGVPWVAIWAIWACTSHFTEKPDS